MFFKSSTFPVAFAFSIVLPLTAHPDVFADKLGQTDLHDATIEHAPADGVVKLYDTGGPHTAFRKVADLWEEMSGHSVEVIAGPESDWTKDAQADVDVLWGTAEQAMTAFLLTYSAFDHDAVEPIYRQRATALKRFVVGPLVPGPVSCACGSAHAA